MDTNFCFAFSPQISSFQKLHEQLKDVILPAKVFQESEKYALWGYFSSYNPYIPEDSLVEEIQKYGLERIANSDCEYLLFVWDKQEKKLVVGADNTISLSCYFTILDNRIIFSSSFAEIKNIVSRHKPLVADLDGLLTYATAEWHAGERTILESVKMVPPGSLVEFVFEPKVLYQIKSLISVEKFLSLLPKEKFKDDKEFVKAFKSALTEALKRRLEKIPSGIQIGCEVSSGFDCTLVAYIMAKLIGPKNFYCYSFCFPEGYGTESPLIIRKFADKHSLQLKIVKIDPRKGYARDYFRLWENDDLLQLRADYFGDYIRFLEKHSPRLLFTGQHGDENFSGEELLLTAKYRRQMSYFDNVGWLKKENQAVFYTKKGLELLLDWERFNSRGRYPVFYSDVNLIETALIDQIYRSFGTRQVSPYLDLRVLSVAVRRDVKNKRSWDEKQFYFRYLDHIFLPEMFIPKKGGTEFALGFPRNQKALISWVMKNSVLADYGLIDPKKILEMVNDENSPLHKDAFLALAFEYLVRADWYLIKNRIRLPV